MLAGALPLLDFGGCAWLARKRRSSRGARSNRRMIDCISSELGASMKAKPLDSWVSGLRMTFTSSYTRFSELSQDLMSSLVTQTGRFPRKTVKLILLSVLAPLGICGNRFEDSIHESYPIVSHGLQAGKRKKIVSGWYLRSKKLKGFNGEGSTATPIHVRLNRWKIEPRAKAEDRTNARRQSSG
jgi:hypothetical protein